MLFVLFQKLAIYCSVLFPHFLPTPWFSVQWQWAQLQAVGSDQSHSRQSCPSIPVWLGAMDWHGTQLWLLMEIWEGPDAEAWGNFDFLSSKGHVWLVLTLPLFLRLPSWPALCLLLHLQSCHHVSISMMGMPGSHRHGIWSMSYWINASKHLAPEFLPCEERNPLLSKLLHLGFCSVHFSSVQSLSRVWLFATPTNHSTPVLSVHHQLPEFTQTHVHQVGDAIHPSHPLLSPSPPAPNPSQHQSLFQWVSSSHQMAIVLELQHRFFQWIFRVDFL